MELENAKANEERKTLSGALQFLQERSDQLQDLQNSSKVLNDKLARTHGNLKAEPKDSPDKQRVTERSLVDSFFHLAEAMGEQILDIGGNIRKASLLIE
tara:strand:+ start:9339 stop:9635 length:297 start_codon:yes stop_codon:yes gene_type:complete